MKRIPIAAALLASALTPAPTGASPPPFDSLWVMNADGSAARELAFTAASWGDESEPSWSPDGSRLVQGDHRLEISDADGGGSSMLTEASGDEDPVWSPDGDAIAFVDDGDIFLISPEGTDLRRLTATEEWDHDPSWSPDGSRLTFVAGWGDDSHLDLMNRDGTERTLLAEKRVVGTPTWAPDGSRIAFGAADGEIHVVNTDGTGTSAITETDADESHPDWSPDGELIAFGGSAGIGIVAPDGSDRRLLSDTGRHPDWSPDGTRIAFDHEGSIVVLSTLEGTREILADGVYGEARVPSWSPDGTRIAFLIHHVPPDHGDPIRGTAAADILIGSPGADRIWARGGNDLVVGRGGNDLLRGGAGDDRLRGSPGADLLNGGGGRDVLLGGPGRDELEGKAHADTLRGGDGRDLCHEDRGDRLRSCERLS